MRRAGPSFSSALLRRCLACHPTKAPTAAAGIISLRASASAAPAARAPVIPTPLAAARQAFATAAASTDTASASTTPPQPLFEDPRVAILEAALARVPEHGWTEDALAAGAASLGFPAVAHGMFMRGAAELVEHFADRVDAEWLAALNAQKAELAALPSARERLKLAIQLRLRLLAPQLSQWPQALALGLLPQNLEATAKRVALLADELCFVCAKGQGPEGPGQERGSVDALDWYAQRAAVGSVYVAAELFFLTDYSEDHSDTWDFLDRRLHDLDSLSHAPRSVQEGVLAIHTAAGAMASAAASLAQPAVWAAVQRLPLNNGALLGALQTALANVAAMAPPAVDPFRPPTAGAGSGPSSTAAGAGGSSGSSSSTGADFPAPFERDPYEINKGATKGAAAGLGGLGGSGSKRP